MTDVTQEHNRRVLVIDDNVSIHEDMRKVLAASDRSHHADDATAAMLGPGQPDQINVAYDIDFATQGQEGLEKIQLAAAQGRPYALAFIDMRMPPGWDGLETLQHIWAVNSDIQCVICTAYSDYTWDDIIASLGISDRLLILKKPFDEAEVSQIAMAMTEKWSITRSNEVYVSNLQHTKDQLQKSNDRLYREVSNRKAAEEKLRHSAFHDPLTDLPNRALLLEQIERSIERSKRHEDYNFAVLFLDLDNFKVINDSLGHQKGDELLIEVAHRLQTSLRMLDTTSRPANDTAARLGGDEFIIHLDGLQHPGDATMVAERVLDQLSAPMILHGHEIQVTASIGVALDENGYHGAGDILRDADTALQEAKANGKGKYLVFSKKMRQRAIHRLQMEEDLRKAINRQELRLQYQPIVSLTSGHIEGFEALLRWDHPESGLISPQAFIPIAEETGLIITIGEWVLREACRQGRVWQDKYQNLKAPYISVNLSPKQFANANLMQSIQRVLQETGLGPRHLKLEITENAVIENNELAAKILKGCQELGIEIYLDDFGTGYTSLSYLHDLPINAIKIDQAFTKDMSLNGQHAATIQAIQTLAQNRGMKVIVEGIEILEQLCQVQVLDCEFGQGYYFSKPLDAEQAEAMLLSTPTWLKSA